MGKKGRGSRGTRERKGRGGRMGRRRKKKEGELDGEGEWGRELGMQGRTRGMEEGTRLGMTS